MDQGRFQISASQAGQARTGGLTASSVDPKTAGSDPPPPIAPPPTVVRCRELLYQWRRRLSLSQRELGRLRGELVQLDRQLQRLQQHSLRIAVFGRGGVGKSSLINALSGEPLLATANPAKHPDSQAVLWQPLQLSIELDKFPPQTSQFPLGQAQALSPLIQEFAAANNGGRGSYGRRWI